MRAAGPGRARGGGAGAVGGLRALESGDSLRGLPLLGLAGDRPERMRDGGRAVHIHEGGDIASRAPRLLLAVVDRGSVISLDIDEPLGRPHGLAQGLEIALLVVAA